MGQDGPSLPSVARQAVNLAIAALSQVHLGRRVATEVEIAERRAACEACPQRTSANRCAACGCFLSVKQRWASAKCPEARWPLPQVAEPKEE